MDRRILKWSAAAAVWVGVLALATLGPPGAAAQQEPPLQPGIYGLVFKAPNTATQPGIEKQPVAGANVVFHMLESQFPTFAPIPDYKTVTGNLGRFEFPNAFPGKWEAVVEKEGFQRGSYIVEYFLADGQEPYVKYVEFPLAVLTGPTPTATATPTPETGRVVFGRVFEKADAAGAAPLPLPGAVVEVYPALADSTATTQPLARAETNEEGWYRLELPADSTIAGPFAVVASKPGYLRVSVILERIPATGKRLDFYLQPEPQPPAERVVFGRVMTRASEPATGANTASQPIEGALVEIRGQYEIAIYPPPPPIASAITGPQGEYRIVVPETVPKELRAVASKEGYKAESRSFEQVPAGGLRLDFFLAPLVEPTPTPIGEGGICGLVVERSMLTVILPIPGAVVEVFRANPAWTGPATGDTTQLPEPVMRVIAGDDGSFCAKPLAPGGYFVRAAADGYLPEFRHLYVPAGDPVEVVLALTPKPVEPTPTPGLPTGTIYGEVKARRVNSEGEEELVPLPGAEVIAYPPMPTLSDPAAGDFPPYSTIPVPVRVVLTDREGKYVMPEFPQGHYILIARKPGFTQAEQIVQVVENERVEANFVLAPAPGPTPEPTPTPDPQAGGLHGLVFDGLADCAPGADCWPPRGIPGAEVLVFPAWAEENGAPGRPLPLLGRAVTNEEGFYRIAPLPAGEVVVRALHPRFQPARVKAEVKPATSTLLNIGMILLPDPTVTPTVTPQEPAVFPGYVVTIAADGTEKPINGAKVCLFSEIEAGAMRPGVAACAETNDLGEFILTVRPGEYAAVASALGFEREVKKVELAAGMNPPVVFALTPATEPTPTPEPQYGRVEGRTLRDPGALDILPPPLPGVLVTLYTPKTSAGDLGEPVARTRSDEEGRFAMGRLLPGVYIGVAEKEGFERDVHPVEVKAGETTQAAFLLKPREVEPTPTPEPQRGALAGLVIETLADPADVSTSAPIAGAKVSAFLVNRTDTASPATRPAGYAVTDRQGRWRIGGLPAGEYLLIAEARGYEPGRAGAQVIAGEVTRALIQLNPKPEPDPTAPGTIAGVALQPAAQDPPTTGALPRRDPQPKETVLEPVEGSTITTYLVVLNSAEPAALEPSGQAVTDAQGRFEIPGLAAGVHLVIAQAEGLRPAVRLAHVLPGGLTRVEMILKPIREDQPGSEEPPPMNIIAQENPADDDEAQWFLYGDPNQFDLPDGERRDGELVLRARNGDRTFGAWQTRDNFAPRDENALYRIRFTVATDQENPLDAPRFRARLNNNAYQQVDAFEVFSIGDADLAPTPAGRLYTWWVEPMRIGRARNVEADGHNFSFDLVNVDGEDAENGELILKSLRIDAVPRASIGEARTLRQWTFANGDEGWFPGWLPNAFDAPEFDATQGALRTRSRNQNGVFGAWISPLFDFTCPEAGALLRIRFRIQSNQADPSLATQLRIRLNSLDNQLCVQRFILSEWDGANSPDATGREYSLFLEVLPELAYKGVYFSFDHIAFNPQDAEDNELALDYVVVERVTNPLAN